MTVSETKIYLAVAKDFATGKLHDCKIIADDSDVAETKAKKFFDECLSNYELEVTEIKKKDDEKGEELFEKDFVTPGITMRTVIITARK